MAVSINYGVVYVFTKTTDLLQWFDSSHHYEMSNDYPSRSLGFNQLRQNYARPREVQLLLLVRYEGSKVFCKIKCPINPLPIRGEFEAASFSSIMQFLKKEGWTKKQKLYPSMLKGNLYQAHKGNMS